MIYGTNEYADGKRGKPAEWERIGSDWYEMLGHFQAKTVIENVSGESLLDLACGDGFLTKQLCNHFNVVVGVDTSEKNIGKARQLCPNAIFHMSSIEEFETEDKWDVVILIFVLEHVDDPIKVLKKAASFLKPTGRLVAQVPNANAINRRIGQNMGLLDDLYRLSDWDKNVGHNRYYDMKLLVRHCEDSGLRVIKTGGIVFKTLSTPQIEWFFREGLWQSGQFGWGGEDKEENWRFKFCNALYEIGKEYPEDCNLVYAVAGL